MAKAAEAFRTISEVAEELDLHKHVLRFWEVKFPQIKPMKRGGGRRYYRPTDMELLRGIRHLLHAEGYTIKGVQKILRERGIDAVKRVGTDTGEIGKGGTPTAAASSVARAEGAAIDSAAATGRNPLKSDGATPPARSARTADQQPIRRRPAHESPQGTRTHELRQAIAELEACRAILSGAANLQSGEAAAAKSKRAVRAAG